MTGRVLSHFEILEKLGEGGMGVVYKARDTLLNRLVAIKVLPPGKVADPERRKRFIHEARSASALNHPNIITIYEISQADGVDFIAMEYVEGRTLDQMVPKTGMRINEALRYAVEIAGALDRAHAEGIVHRDLKPSNIMVATDGRLKILDFGLAKLTEIAVPGEDEATLTAARLADVPHTEEGGIVGTIAYMSPEQAEGKPVDARSDIFSFGSVLYEMISGRRAFKGETRMSTMAAVLREEPTPLAQLVPGVPREVEKLVVRCLRKDPQRRAQHMSDLRLALEELKEESDSGLSLPAAAPPVSPKRRRWLIPAIAIAVLALAGLGVVTTYHWRRASRGEPKLVPLTSYEGIEGGPALSPDGQQVAFEWDGDNEQNVDIYVKLVDAGNPIRLTKHPGPDLAPAWSPDGRFLVFTRLGPARGYYVIPALGGPERKVADILKESSQLRPPRADWMADSKSVVIVDNSLDPPALAQVAVDSGEKKRLTFPPATYFGDFHPRVSPDGRQVAFLRQRDSAFASWLTLRLDQAGSSEPNPVTNLVSGGRAAWSADEQIPDRQRFHQWGNPARQGGTFRASGARTDWRSRYRRLRALHLAAGDSPCVRPPFFRYQLVAGGPGEAQRPTRPHRGIEQRRDDAPFLARWDQNRFRLLEVGEPGTMDRGSSLAGDKGEDRVAEIDSGWDLSAGGVYYFQRNQRLLTVQRLDLSTRRDSTVLTLPSEASFGGRLAVSPDGRWLVFVREDQRVSDLMLLDNFR